MEKIKLLQEKEARSNESIVKKLKLLQEREAPRWAKPVGLVK